MLCPDVTVITTLSYICNKLLGGKNKSELQKHAIQVTQYTVFKKKRTHIYKEVRKNSN